jgi:hypothetical protein
MLTFRHISRNLSLALLLIMPALSGCADASFFPRERPLFPGLDEAHVPAKSKPSLAKAQTDFQLARRGKDPRYARYVGTDKKGTSKLYQGEGYRLALVHRDEVSWTDAGPDIVLEPSLTGGPAYHYDEVDRMQD